MCAGFDCGLLYENAARLEIYEIRLSRIDGVVKADELEKLFSDI
jgi:hypothetical protein